MDPRAAADIQGLVDSHVHIRNTEGLEQLAQAGIGAARDAGFRENAGLAALLPSSKKPIVVSAGWALYKKGGYGSRFGVAVDSREEIRAEILKLKHAGAGIIKVMASGVVSLTSQGSITPGGFTEEELSFIVRESMHAGLGVMAHANGEEAIMAAARAGTRSVEHGFFMSVRALEVLAARGTFWVPTVGALARAVVRGKVSAKARAYFDGLILYHQDMIRRAQNLGVVLAVGTDCVLPDPGYGAAYRAELNYFEQAGLSPDMVQEMASVNGARLLGIDSSQFKVHSS